MKRVFIAVNLPEKVKKEIFEKISMHIPKKDCKIVEEKNLHITLKFLGYLSEEKIEELKEKMKSLEEFKKFFAKLNGIGDFGGRVIWIGLQKGNEELIQISKKLDELIELRNERFHAHITIARNKNLRAKEVSSLIEKLNAEKIEKNFLIESIDLMESILSTKGPTYLVLFKVKLK